MNEKIVTINYDELHPKIAATIKNALQLQKRLDNRDEYKQKIHPFTVIRKLHGLTQLEFAQTLGVSNSLISLIENGKRTCPDNLLIMVANLYDPELLYKM